METDQTEHLPPFPRRLLYAVSAVLAFAGALLLIDSFERWWGIKPLIPLPYSTISGALQMAVLVYFWFAAGLPERRFARPPKRRVMFALLTCLAVFAAVLVPSVV